MYKFDNQERDGAESLKKAGYVEFDKFRSTVVGKISANREPIGYFCANCAFNQKKDGGIHDSFCNKIKAENATWGCCNFWEYKAMELTTVVQPDVVASPEQEPKNAIQSPVQKQVAKPAPVQKQAIKPVQKVAPKPVQKLSPKQVQENINMFRKLVKKHVREMMSK